MNFLEKILRSNFLIKLRNWEYWPFGIIQLPAFVYWLWLSVRARSLVFFSASNPGIAMGGMFGESKYDILKKISARYVPKTLLVKSPATREAILALLKETGLTYPLVFKPDLGERGFRVKKIVSKRDIDDYLKNFCLDFIIQEWVDLPLEFGVFYSRHPLHDKGIVTSLVRKEMLTVTGNGHATLRELILQKDRAKLQWKTLKENFRERLEEVLPNGCVFELVYIGNHCRGAKFLDACHLINDKLSETFDAISKEIEGFYYGRFDLRCASEEDLYQGNVKILELNGCGAEPVHIYQPGFPLLKAIGVLLKHWKDIFEISCENHRRGVEYVSFAEGIRFYRKFKKAVR